VAHSLYEQYGGFAAISRIVLHFYDQVLDSDILAGYFENTDMRRLVDHQTKFVASLLGGPASYTDETLRQVHARLKIDGASFDEMVRLFTGALKAFDLADEHIEQVIGGMVARRDLIVTVK
jgi:hemoglobin